VPCLHRNAGAANGDRPGYGALAHFGMLGNGGITAPVDAATLKRRISSAVGKNLCAGHDPERLDHGGTGSCARLLDCVFVMRQSGSRVW
jgi:hypothetical protein